MSDISITYKGNEIASMDDSGTKTLLTGSTWCEDDIVINYTKSGGGGGGVTTVSFGDDAYFGSDEVIYVDGSGTVQVINGYLAIGSACSYQMMQGSSIVMFGDMAGGSLSYTGTMSGISLITTGTMSILASRGSGTLVWAVFQVD